MAQTPPNHPLHNVHLSTAQVQHVLKGAVPSAELLSCTQLPEGSSYNNRIYVLEIRHRHGTGSSLEQRQELVLKVCGKFWTHAKTINEVLCLETIARKCSNIPVPKVVAWCADRSTSDGIGHEWILMTKLPGATLASMKLTGLEKRSIMQDLARIISLLRQNMASPSTMGNLGRAQSEEAVVVGGLVDFPTAENWPWVSYLDYFRGLLGSHVGKLQEDPTYAQNRFLIPMFQTFISEKLQDLAIFHDARMSRSVMTHNDLSSKNILVSRNPNTRNPDTSAVYISGLIDWEFSGFFSPVDEFLAMSDELNEHDSSQVSCGQLHAQSLSETFFQNLQEYGISTPINGFIKEHWDTATMLSELEASIAPWWLRDHPGGDDLTAQLYEASAAAVALMDKLSKKAVAEQEIRANETSGPE